jgi:Flp pilus assembly protein TadG
MLRYRLQLQHKHDGTDMPTKDSRERGAVIVEFALLLPIFLLLILGILEFGRLYNIQSTLSGAAREGVRVMALTNDSSGARQAVYDFAPTLEPARMTIETPACANPANGARTTVTVKYSANLVTGFFGQTMPLKGTGTMRCNG